MADTKQTAGRPALSPIQIGIYAMLIFLPLGGRHRQKGALLSHNLVVALAK